MIQFERVSFYYAAKTILRDIELTIHSHETVVIIGPSGCGKTTLIRLINGMLKPEEGSILIHGQPIDYSNLPKLRRSMGYVIQGIGLFPHLTVFENIALLARRENWTASRIKERVLELLEMVHLPPHEFHSKYPMELSGGQHQRVGVARALMLDPPFLLMDEPFGALDPMSRKNIQDEFLKIIRQLKKTCVLVTHDLLEAFKLADRLLLLEGTKIQQIGLPEDLLSHPANDFTRRFIRENMPALPHCRCLQ
jgi:osmoprotectant transport system ATP-binding protein